MANAPDSSAFNTITQMTLVDWLDDLTVRFLLNLPPAELSSVPRLCFQVEEAQWFYEDFIRPANPTLPSLNLRQFLLTLFQHCPLLSGFDATQHVAAYEEFLSYKVRVPVRGAILMDESMEKVLLVRGWKKGASWSFPRGKINKDEKDLDCAIREVYEETGYDIAATGLVQSNEQQNGQVKAIDVTMREQHMKLFVFRGVPLDTHFEPRTRKEISKISWYNVKDLPGFKKQNGVAGQGRGEAATSKFYMVAPFLGHLKKWIGQQRKNDHAAADTRQSRNLSTNYELQVGTTEDEGETEQGFTTDNGLTSHDQSAERLRRLLSIDNFTRAPQAHISQAQSFENTNSLLAMLKGSHPSEFDPSHAQVEHTDLPISLQQSEAPRLQHTQAQLYQLHELQQQQPVPNFLPSKGYVEQQQYHHQDPSLAAFNSVRAKPKPYSLHHQQRPAFVPAHIQQPSHKQDTERVMPMSQPGRNLGALHDSERIMAEVSPDLFLEEHTSSHLRNGNNIWKPLEGTNKEVPERSLPVDVIESSAPNFDQISHELQKPLDRDESVPNASSLQSSQLNEHSLRLLDAFKGTHRSKVVTRNVLEISTSLPAGGQQQTALLNLFKKPSGVATDPVKAYEPPINTFPAPPALTDTTVKPAPRTSIEQMTTLNLSASSNPEITNPAVVTPQIPQALQLQQTTSDFIASDPGGRREMQSLRSPRSQRTTRTAISIDSAMERPKSRGHLYDPKDSKRPVRTSPQTKKSEVTRMSVPVAQTSLVQSLPQSPRATAKMRSKPASSEATNLIPQFSILQRPTSSAGHGLQSSPIQSPLLHDVVQASQPQLLKRIGSSEGKSDVSSEQGICSSVSMVGDAKKDHLLSLLGKGYNAPVTTTLHNTTATPDLESSKQKQQKTDLLGLFNSAVTPLPYVKSPGPPPAPQLTPDGKPSGQTKQLNQQRLAGDSYSSQTLLNLFNKSASNTLTSPGTPISPFTLSSPSAGGRPSMKLSVQASEPKSRMGSMVSVTATSVGSGQQTPKTATPTAETKGFLLDYLNGVVQKEGYRGPKKQ